MIPFNAPCVYGGEEDCIKRAIKARKFSGDGEYNKKCEKILETITGSKKVLMTSSCTHALELSALAIGIKPGDEVIMPSYTFTSTANAFVLRGAKIIFVDIRPDTMNIDENKIERAITKKTKAIVPVHYAGVSCEMDKIMKIAKKYKLRVIEDAAQALTSTYKGKHLGAIGDIGTISFHETKNIQCGEGGAILINDPDLIEKIEIYREKGTDRSKFFRGEVDKYGWVDQGSSYLLSELAAAFLYPQLKAVKKITSARAVAWKKYYKLLKPLERGGLIDLPTLPAHCVVNYHNFYIKLKNINERSELIKYLKNKGVYAVFHYIPLHSSPAGKKFGKFVGKDVFTTKESERILRLPLFYGLGNKQIEKVTKEVKSFFRWLQ